MLVSAIQITIAIVLLNVWLVRANRKTKYRGGYSNTLLEEFAAYGLPIWLCYTVGILKVSAAIMLLVGLWKSNLVIPATLVVGTLMVGAVAMHFKIRDPLVKSFPALAMIALCVLNLALR